MLCSIDCSNCFNFTTIKKTAIAIGVVLLETISKVAVFILIGILTSSLFPFLSNILLTYAASTIVSRLVVKAIDWYDLSLLDRIKSTADHFLNRFSHFHIVGFFAAVLVYPLNATISLSVISLCGIVNGVQLGSIVADLNRV